MKKYLWAIVLVITGYSPCSWGENIDSDANDVIEYCWQNKVTSTKILSWNAFSTQFIDPPTFKLLVIPDVYKYVAEVCQGGRKWTVESTNPMVSLVEVWPQMNIKTFTLRFLWLDKEGNVLAEETTKRVKAPDWQGFNEPCEDWVAAADRGMAYLMDVADNGKAPYREPNVPVWIWSCASPTKTDLYAFWDAVNPNGCPMGYPCITLNRYIGGFLAYAQRNGPQKDEAMKLAKVCADWALKNHQPENCALPLFPYSTIGMGKFSGGAEGDNVNLLRPCRLATSFVDLYQITGNKAYLDYARHIANTVMKFQKSDGSFPYRINPQSGKVTEDYTCAAVEFTTLVDGLKPFGFDPNMAIAAQRALDWTLAYVCNTGNWKAIFEDNGTHPAYANLAGSDTQIVIRYLCRHKDEDPAYLPTARRLNRWLEDQFVLFGPESEAYVHPVRGLLRMKGPLVFEQYQCWFPMEGHTGSWILTLIELHKATGDVTYLDKAKAAANAICALQFEDGQFSTMGLRYYKDGVIVSDKESGFNWYNANAAASTGLYALDKYLNSL